MAQAYRETTVWTTNTLNHSYYLEGSNILAYIPHGTDQVTWFTSPIKIDRRGRKFEQMEVSPFDRAPERSPLIRRVVGSKGGEYVINLTEGSCSCPGYQFRGACRHIKEIEHAE
jgi:hypothetical protein